MLTTRASVSCEEGMSARRKRRGRGNVTYVHVVLGGDLLLLALDHGVQIKVEQARNVELAAVLVNNVAESLQGNRK